MLLYLNEEHAGGHTVFYRGGEATPSNAVHVEPKAGSAVVFFHGKHPCSPLHEGAPLEQGATVPKYVIRNACTVDGIGAVDVLSVRMPALITIEWPVRTARYGRALCHRGQFRLRCVVVEQRGGGNAASAVVVGVAQV